MEFPQILGVGETRTTHSFADAISRQDQASYMAAAYRGGPVHPGLQQFQGTNVHHQGKATGGTVFDDFPLFAEHQLRIQGGFKDEF